MGMQYALDRCHQRRLISYFSFNSDLLYEQDCKILKKTTSVDSQPLNPRIPPQRTVATISKTEDVHALM